MQLDYELYNVLASTIVICLMIWFARLINIAQAIRELEHAEVHNHVIRLRGLGSSLSLLAGITRPHLQHILRTKKPTAPTKMKAIEVPFKVNPRQLSIVERCVATPPSAPDTQQSFSLGIKIGFDTLIPCFVQVYWGIKASEIDEIGPLGLPYGEVLHSPKSLSKYLSAEGIVSPSTDEVYSTDSVRLSEELFSPGSYIKKSKCKLYASGNAREFEIDEEDMAESTMLSLLEYPLQIVVPSSEEEESVVKRYPCVIVFFSLSQALKAIELEHYSSGKMKKDAMGRRDLVVCQCHVVNFVHCDDSATKLKPVLVQQYDFSLSNVYFPQEIYGTDLTTPLECVICLEEPKDTTLLPCRHLCVCSICLREIDQCPICRSTFSNYVVFDGYQNGAGVREQQIRVAI